jgi:hypothetical protein
MKNPGRVLLTVFLLGVAGFCVFGMMASGEVERRSTRLIWQFGYGAVGLWCVIGMIRLWMAPYEGDFRGMRVWDGEKGWPEEFPLLPWSGNGGTFGNQVNGCGDKGSVTGGNGDVFRGNGWPFGRAVAGGGDKGFVRG